MQRAGVLVGFAALTSLVGAGVLPACARTADSESRSAEEPPLIVGRVVVHGEIPASMEAWVDAALRDSPEFVRGQGSDAAVATWIVEPRTEAVVRLTADLRSPTEHLQTTVELEREAGTLQWAEDLPLLIKRGVALLEAQRRLNRLGDREARRLLRSDDPELALLALTWAAEERRVGLLQAIRDKLGDPDSRLASAAVEGIAIVGTVDDVPLLITTARLSDREHTGRLYATLGELGGPEAAGFLAFAARNEEDPVLAGIAEKAAERAQDRRRVRRTPALRIVRGHRDAQILR